MTYRGIAVLMLILVTATGCATLTGRSFGTVVDDTTTTATVKAKLTAERPQNLTWIDVDTRNGIVYLTGNARDDMQRQRALELAAATRGVRQVVNNIQITGSDRMVAAAAASRTTTTAPAPVVTQPAPVVAQTPPPRPAPVQPSAQPAQPVRPAPVQPAPVQPVAPPPPPSGGTPVALAAPAASPATGGTVIGRYSLTGEVVSVDRTTGRVVLRTPDRTVDLQLAPDAARNLNRGDRLAVDTAFRQVK